MCQADAWKANTRLVRLFTIVAFNMYPDSVKVIDDLKGRAEHAEGEVATLKTANASLLMSVRVSFCCFLPRSFPFLRTMCWQLDI